MLTIGKNAPHFNCVDQYGQTHTLEQYLGKKVVLYIYPKDNTPACINQACSMRDFKDELSEHNAVVLGVSMDDERMHLKFSTKNNLNFPLLVDSSRSLIDALGIWGEKKFMGRTYDGIHRTTFIIDETGKIEHIITKPKTKIHGEEVLNYLKRNEMSELKT